MSDYRAKPKRTGWLLQRRRFGMWWTVYRHTCGLAIAVWFKTLPEVQAEAARRRAYDKEQEIERRREMQHEAQPPVMLY